MQTLLFGDGTNPGIISDLITMTSDIFAFFTTEPVVYFVGLALLGVAIKFGKGLIPTKKG